MLLLAGFAVLTALLAWGGPLLDLDTAIANWAADHQPGFFYWLARGFNFVGNGGPLTVLSLAIAIALAVRHRTIRPVLPVVAAFLATGFAILPIKLWTDRAAPTAPVSHSVELFNQDSGVSYPSGHLVNTVVWYGILTMLLAPWLTPTVRRWLRVAPPAIVFVTTVYLDFHWLTDSVAGLLLGVVLDRLLARIPWGLPSDGAGASGDPATPPYP